MGEREYLLFGVGPGLVIRNALTDGLPCSDVPPAEYKVQLGITGSSFDPGFHLAACVTIIAERCCLQSRTRKGGIVGIRLIETANISQD